MDRAEKIGLGAATAGHVLLFGLLSVGFLATPNPVALERPPVEVQFVDEVALEATTPSPSEQAPATSVAPELGAPEDAPPPEPAPPEPAPEPPRAAPPVPAPAPTPRPAPKAADPVRKPTPPAPKAAQRPAPAPAPAKPAPQKPAPPVREAARGSRLGPDFLKGITDKASPTRNTTAIDAAIGPAQRSALAAELLRQLRPHWRSPTGADVEQLRVVVVARLNKDGSLAGEPRAEAVTGITPGNRAQAELFAERAVAAVKRGAPFNFPPDLYDAWKEIRPRFRKDL